MDLWKKKIPLGKVGDKVTGLAESRPPLIYRLKIR